MFIVIGSHLNPDNWLPPYFDYLG